MDKIFNVEAWRQVFVNSITQLGQNLAAFLPKLVATIVILLAGWLVARVVEFVTSRALRRLGFDTGAARLRVQEVLGNAGIAAPPSRLVARLLYWILMLVFLLSAVETLGLTAVTSTIDRLIAFLPNLVAASLIVLFTVLLGKFLRNLVGSGAAVANLGQAKRLGMAANTVVVLVGSVLAIQQLGIETGLFVSVITVLVAALTLTMGIAFALGARPVVTHILAGHFLRQTLTVGQSVEVEGKKGDLEQVGATATVLRDGAASWSIPNARLLDAIVAR